MTTITTPIVGSYHRPPAQQVLKILPLSTPLTLIPEPDNPYDPAAIKVLVSLSTTYPISRWGDLQEALEGTGYDAHELIRQESTDGPLHLGYIPASGAKTCKGGPGNLEVAQAIANGPNSTDLPFTAILTTLPDGSPAVTITIEDPTQ